MASRNVLARPRVTSRSSRVTRIARAHHAALQRAAGAVVVAHLDRALESAAGARIGRPVELRRADRRRDSPARSAAGSRSSNFGARTILPGLYRPFGSKRSFTSSKARTSSRAEHLVVEFRAHDAVAVLAGMRALVGAHQVERLLGDRPHRLDVLLKPQIQDRPHMQAADRGMRIPGAARAVLLENVRQLRGVVRQMIERHRAVLDERDRLSLLLHRHHDVEAGGAHLVDGGLQLRIEHLDHAALLRAAACPTRCRDRRSTRSVAPGAGSSRSSRPRRTRRTGSPRDRRARPRRWSAGTSRFRAPAPAWCDRPVRPRSGRA